MSVQLGWTLIGFGIGVITTAATLAVLYYHEWWRRPKRRALPAARALPWPVARQLSKARGALMQDVPRTRRQREVIEELAPADEDFERTHEIRIDSGRTGP